MTTLQAVDKCISDTLTDDSTFMDLCTGGVFRELAPQGAAYPLTIFGLQSGIDRNMIGPQRAFTSGDYLVKAITCGDSFEVNEQIMARADALLQYRSMTIEGVRVQRLHRQSIFRYVEFVNGKRFNHYGFIYRFFSYAL